MAAFHRRANHILGLRLNDWTSLLIFVSATTYLIIASRSRDGGATIDTKPDTNGSVGAREQRRSGTHG